MASAGRRDVGEDLAAAPGHELADRRGLRGHLVAATLTMVLSSTTISCAADPAGIEVKHEHPARG